MAFWIAAIGMAGAVLSFLALAVLRRPRALTTEGAAHDIGVYRDQLAEVERDLARGTLAAAEAGRIRTEVARRILDADRRRGRTAAGRPAGGATLTAALVLLIAAAGAAVALYSRLGAPGYPDQPLAARIAEADRAMAARPAQAAAEAALGPAPLADPEDPGHAELIARLRVAVAARPADAEGHRLLARNEAALGNFAAAARAQGRLVVLLGADARAGDHALHADLMIRAARGYVSPEAEAALTEALRRDPANGAARYYSGLLFAQNGRHDLAFRLWRPLLAESRPDDPWHAPLRAQIEEAAWLAGEHRYVPPAPPAGPGAADIEAAAALSPEERAAMVRGMVAGLAGRLASEGGPAEDWARLIVAYGVLGEAGAAARVLAEARQVFAASDADLARIEAAAREAGLGAP